MQLHACGARFNSFTRALCVCPQWDAASAYVPDQCDKLPSPSLTGQKRKRRSKRTYVVPSGFEKEINRCASLMLTGVVTNSTHYHRHSLVSQVNRSYDRVTGETDPGILDAWLLCVLCCVRVCDPSGWDVSKVTYTLHACRQIEGILCRIDAIQVLQFKDKQGSFPLLTLVSILECETSRKQQLTG